MSKIVKKRSPHVNNIIHKIIECLRSASRPLLLEEIEQTINMNLSNNEDLLAIIRDNRKINYDETQNRYSLRKLYNISDKDSLIRYLKEVPRGVPENQDLFDCYRGIEKDIQHLKQEGYIRVIYNAEKDKKFNVLFYKNPDETVERIGKPVEDNLKTIWRSLERLDVTARRTTIEEAYKKRKI